MDFKLEVVVLPVSDVDRAKDFYGKVLGWREDADYSFAGGGRIVQFNPPGSACSIHFGVGVTTAEPGSVRGTVLVVDDIDKGRADLLDRGVAVGEAFHPVGGSFHEDSARVGGAEPERRSYSSLAEFSDPDGNGWLLQEITERLPGR